MTEVSRQRLYKFGGGASIAISAALFASPFILVALYLIDRAIR